MSEDTNCNDSHSDISLALNIPPNSHRDVTKESILDPNNTNNISSQRTGNTEFSSPNAYNPLNPPPPPPINIKLSEY